MANLVQDIDGKQWRIKSELAKGGFGTIYECLQEDQNEPTAISRKIIKIEKIRSRAARIERHVYYRLSNVHDHHLFCQNRGITHLGIPRLITYGMSLDERFLIMDKYSYSMRTYLRTHKLPKRRVFKTFFHILNILEFMHSLNIIHRDIKDANIVFDHLDKPYLIDYGLCGELGASRSFSSSNNFVGTLRYCSVDGHRGLTTARSDIESLLYCAFFWLKANVPWTDVKSPRTVQNMKVAQQLRNYSDIVLSVNMPRKRKHVFLVLVNYVANLSSDSRPNYQLLRKLSLRLSVPDEIFHESGGDDGG